MAKLSVACLGGDGIGAEVMAALSPVFECLSDVIDTRFARIGWSCWLEQGQTIPDETWALIEACDAMLLGATSSFAPSVVKQTPFGDRAYVSPLIQLRQKLDLYACVRPCFDYQDNRFDVTIIRENTEGLYSGVDYDELPASIASQVPMIDSLKHGGLKVGGSVRVMSEKKLSRIFRFAFAYANQHQKKTVVFADKANVLRKSASLAMDLFDQEASHYPHITPSVMNADACAYQLIRKPHTLDVIVAENMFGDMLSDVGAAVMGGLGLAPSANLGDTDAYFEPVHGSGLTMKANTANPSALAFSLSMLLDHHGYKTQSKALSGALIEVLKAGDSLTYDLGGHASTTEMGARIAHQLERHLNRHDAFV